MIKYSLEWAVKTSQGIDGWLAPIEAECLYSLVFRMPDNTDIVEIGSYKGRSTLVLASSLINKCVDSGAYDDNCVISIDPHEKPSGIIHGAYDEWAKGTYKSSYLDFLDNLNKYDISSFVYPIRKTSENAKKELVEDLKIGLLFIDGLHQRDWVQLDFELWSPMVVKNGWIAMHDSNPNQLDFGVGPAIVAQNEIIKSGKFKNVGLCKSLVYGQKI